MGYIEAPDGALTYNDDATQNGGPQSDFQKLADLIMKVAGGLRVTSAERLELTASETQVGWFLVETDTGRIYLRTAAEPQGRLVFDPDTNLTQFSAFNTGGGWSGYTGNGFQGVWYQRKNGIVMASGAAGNTGSWPTGSVIMTLPAGFRPAKRWVGSGVEIDVNGNIMTQGAGSGVVTFSIAFPTL